MRARTAPDAVAISPSRVRLENRPRSRPKSQRRAMAPTAMAPMLCRLLTYCGPGLPRPARISMAPRHFQSCGPLGFGLGFGGGLAFDRGGRRFLVIGLP